MRKSIGVLISILFVFSTLLSGCRKTDTPEDTTNVDTENIISQPEESITDAPDESDTGEPNTERPDYSSMKMKGKLKISNRDIGIRFFNYTVSNPMVADIEIRSATTTLYIYNAGRYEVKGTDCFGHSASFVVTVNDDYTTKLDIIPCTENFIEVGAFGAKGIGGDDTKFIQAAIDSANSGDTVYIYPGVYRYTYLCMKEGITLKMYNPMTEASEGYSDRIASEIKRGRATVLVGGRIMNNTKSAYGNSGCSNFTIDGGVLDMDHTYTGAIIFGCAEGVTLKNIIFKDIKGNHAIQYTGCSNSSIINCMFAGYDVGDSFTREVVQIEPSTPGATGSGENAPLKFHAGEFICPENITIDGCYFGKSDEAGAPLMAIGHHSYVGKANVTGFKITNNVFDDCLYAAIRYNNIVDTEISGNIFNATAEYNYGNLFDARDPAFIILYHPDKDTKYTSETDGRTIIRAKAFEQAGIHGLKIENNTFNIAEGSDKRIINYSALSKYTLGAKGVSNILKQDRYDSEIYSYSGYAVNNNVAKDISFSNNTVNVTGRPVCSDHLIAFSNVYGLKFEGNKLNYASGVTFSSKTDGNNGVKLSNNISGDAARTYTVAASSGKAIRIEGSPSGRINLLLSGSASLKLIAKEGGDVKLTVDEKGNLIVSIVCDDGYQVASISDTDGNKITTGGVMSSSATYTVNFTK